MSTFRVWYTFNTITIVITDFGSSQVQLYSYRSSGENARECERKRRVCALLFTAKCEKKVVGIHNGLLRLTAAMEFCGTLRATKRAVTMAGDLPFRIPSAILLSCRSHPL